MLARRTTGTAGIASPAEFPGQESRGSGWGLIGIGLMLALLGAGRSMLMTQGLSHLYVAQYSLGLMELLGCIVSGGVFLRR